MISTTARCVLRGFGAYVGEDWHVPRPAEGDDDALADASLTDPG